MHVSKDAFASAYNEAIKKNQPLLLSPKGKMMSFLCTPVAITEEAIIFKNSIPLEVLPEVITSTEFTVTCRDYLVMSAALFAHGTEIRFPTHHISLLPQSRTEARQIFSSEEIAEVVIAHPFDAGTVLRRRLYDLSKGGLSFRSRTKSKLMQPGRIFEKLEIVHPSAPAEIKSGRIIYIKQIFEESGRNYHQVGIQFINTP
ncbi:MAG: hypothetical protein FJY29_09245 [Betaproteobacteria bacterium]|nr:hypothetical protein [Betaproteobacteria bacterium]